jgi:hypothetical protein
MDVGYLYSTIHNLHFKMNTERNIDPMSDVDKLDPNLKRQYVGAYGEFQAGDYGIGDQIPGLGEVIWSCRKVE